MIQLFIGRYQPHAVNVSESLAREASDSSHSSTLSYGSESDPLRPSMNSMQSSVNGGEEDTSDSISCCCCFSVSARVLWLCFLFVGFLLAIVFREGAFGLFEHISGFQSCSSSSCYGLLGVMRVSFALLTLYSIAFLFTIPCWSCGCMGRNGEENLCGWYIHRKLWTLKLFFFGLFLCGCLWIPNSFFSGYSWLALSLSVLFLFFQIIILFDFACSWNDDWVRKAVKESGNKWKIFLLISSTIFYLGGIVILSLCYVWYSPSSDCSEHIGIITSVLLFGIIYTIISLLVPHGSLLPSSLVFLFCSFRVWSALTSSPNLSCRIRSIGDDRNSSGSTLFQLFFGTVFAALSLIWTVFRAGSAKHAFSLDPNIRKESERASPRRGDGLTFFFVVCVLGSAYMAMLLTGWSVTGFETSLNYAVLRSQAALWVQVASVWTCSLLYIWILIAPLLCPSRDFGHLNSF